MTETWKCHCSLVTPDYSSRKLTGKEEEEEEEAGMQQAGEEAEKDGAAEDQRQGRNEVAEETRHVQQNHLRYIYYMLQVIFLNQFREHSLIRQKEKKVFSHVSGFASA